MKCWVISFCLAYACFFATKGNAQVNMFPSHFGQVMLSRQSLNPALPNLERATNFTVSNRFYTGPYSKIDNLYFIGNVNLNGKDSARYVNSLGVRFVNEREGEFIERPRCYVSYAIRTRVLETYWLALGIEVGRAWYLFKGSDVSTAGSASNWDGNVGIVFSNSTTCLAASVNQLFNSLVLPKDLYFRWARFYTLHAEKRVETGQVEFSFYAQNQFLPDRDDVLDIGTNATLSKVFFLGVNAWVGRSISFQVGLPDIYLEGHHFSLYASYNAPAFNQTSANIQSFEMSLRYRFK